MSAKKRKKDKSKRKKRTARIVCPDESQFWTTQTQFWQWVRDCVVIKTQDNPLTGVFRHAHEPLMVVLSNTILNLANRHHLREALLSRRIMKRKISHLGTA